MNDYTSANPWTSPPFYMDYDILDNVDKFLECG